MADIVFGGALSHSPMMNYPLREDQERVERFKAAVEEMARRLRDARPDVVVIFGPDHFRALFYDLMPAFVIGIDRVDGWGDWNTPVGPFRTHSHLANHIVSHVLNEGFEPAFSREIKIDHGITQPLQLLNVAAPLVPIVVNAAGPPLPTPSRCHQFGAAVGGAISTYADNVRVAVIGSGGLSHDPPAPSEENALHGKTNGFAASRERETRLIQNAGTLQARINPQWDRDFLNHLERGESSSFAARTTTQSIFEAAGNGGQEIRTWLAVAGAVDRKMNVLYYEPISELITGMGVITT